MLVGHSAVEALEHLERDASLAVRVRWALDADTAQSLRTLLINGEGARAVRSAFVDSFYGADDMPAAGRWLRCREVTSGPCVDDGVDRGQAAPLEEAGSGRTWCMRVARCVGNGGHNREAADDHDDDDDQPGGARDAVDAEDDIGTDHHDDGSQRRQPVLTSRPKATRTLQRRRRRIYAHNDECDDARLLRVVAPDSPAADLSDLGLGIYARIAVQRVVIKDAGSTVHVAGATPPALRIVIDSMDMKGGRGHTLVQGSAVVGDVQSASRLIALLRAAGVDPTAPPPPSKVVAYLAWRRPVLCARLVKRGAVDEASFDAS